MTFRIDVGNNFTKVGEALTGEFNAVSRYLATGEWQLTIPPSGLDVDPDAVSSIDTILVTDEDAGRIVYGGLIRSPWGSADTGVTTDVDADGTRLEFRGVDLWGILGQRVVYPDPTEDPPWTSAYDTRTGLGSTVAAGYLADNLGSSALLERQHPDLTIVDPEVGSSSTWDGRLQPLSQLIGRICRDSGVSLHVTMTTPGALLCEFASPVARQRILLSDQGDLEALSQLVTPPSSTFVVAAGQGEGADRAFQIAASGDTGLDRVETVYENTNISTDSGLSTAAATELALDSADTSVAATPTTTTAQRLRYLTDYKLGDHLTVEVGGVRRTAQVEAASFQLTADRGVITPLLGRTSLNDFTNLIRDVAGLSDRFDAQIA